MVAITWISQPVWRGLKSQPGLKISTGLGFLSRAELRPGLNPSQCNRQFDFKRVCFRRRAEISARDEFRHVIRYSINVLSHNMELQGTRNSTLATLS